MWMCYCQKFGSQGLNSHDSFNKILISNPQMRRNEFITLLSQEIEGNNYPKASSIKISKTTHAIKKRFFFNKG